MAEDGDDALRRHLLAALSAHSMDKLGKLSSSSGGDDDDVDDDADDLDDEDQAAVTDDYFMVKAEGICWADLREVRRGAVFRLPGRVARHDFPERAVRCRDLCPREAADRAVASSSGLPG